MTKYKGNTLKLQCKVMLVLFYLYVWNKLKMIEYKVRLDHWLYIEQIRHKLNCRVVVERHIHHILQCMRRSIKSLISEWSLVWRLPTYRRYRKAQTEIKTYKSFRFIKTNLVFMMSALLQMERVQTKIHPWIQRFTTAPPTVLYCMLMLFMLFSVF